MFILNLTLNSLLLSTQTGRKLQGTFGGTHNNYQVTRRTKCGMRDLTMFTSLHPLRHGRCLTQVFPSCTFKEFRNLSQTSWSSPKILNQREPRTFGSYFLKPLVVHFSCRPRPSEDDIKMNKAILSLKTVKEQLELFERIKNSASVVNRVTMLYSIAKITKRNGNQWQVLEQEKGKPIQALSSTYLTLLDSISKDIAKCQPRHLANVIWALGKLGGKDHTLVQVCERAILSCGITALGNAGICQIVSGCLNLDLTATEISSTLQESIRNGKLKLSNFNNQVLSAMLMLFAKSDGCAFELFDIFLDEILSRDFLLMDSTSLAYFVWSFAKKELNSDTLFDRVEGEILRRGTANLKRRQIVQILWAFSKAKKEVNQLFYIMDNELASRGVQGFRNSELLQIVWSFATRYVTYAKVFDLVKDEVFNLGVGMFETHKLVLILYSFVFAQRQNIKLVEEIESELLSRDVERFSNGLLCQVAWSLGRVRKSDSKMFDVIEESVFQRGLHQFSKSEKFLLLLGYVEAKWGSKKLYECLQVSFLKSCFLDLTAREIYLLACYFSEAENFTGPLINTGQLFDTLEMEILTKRKLVFKQQQLNRIKEGFQKVGKGTNELFELRVS